ESLRAEACAVVRDCWAARRSARGGNDGDSIGGRRAVDRRREDADRLRLAPREGFVVRAQRADAAAVRYPRNALAYRGADGCARARDRGVSWRFFPRSRRAGAHARAGSRIAPSVDRALRLDLGRRQSRRQERGNYWWRR